MATRIRVTQTATNILLGSRKIVESYVPSKELTISPRYSYCSIIQYNQLDRDYVLRPMLNLYNEIYRCEISPEVVLRVIKTLLLITIPEMVLILFSKNTLKEYLNPNYQEVTYGPLDRS